MTDQTPSRAQAASVRDASDSAPAAKPLNKRQRAKIATRKKVLAAARALFEAGGYHDATIRDIARAAGMSTGAVFASFECKADVWRAAFGGPPPSREVADEIARTLGELPGCSWTLSHHEGRFQAVVTSPDFNPVAQTGTVWPGRGDGPAAALRMAREAALAAQPTHAVRRAEAA